MSIKKTLDGNMVASYIAYAFSEVAAIYPITPSSNMGEYADAWASEYKKNIFDQVVDVVEMQSEAGAAGAVHGSLSGGSMTTTFTASQGLLLMIPNMYKIAGEMLPTVFHVSARSLAAQSLSIFGDHSDVMAARNTGFAFVAASNIQEIMDLAIVSHLATLKAKIPFLNFFDGFRNSHEIQKIDLVDYEVLKTLIEPEYIEDFRKRALDSCNPTIKVAAQNPDVYFQGRETTNLDYAKIPEIVLEYMKKVEKITGRSYKLFDYFGAKDAEKVIVSMGSSCDTIEETINYLNQKGAKLGLVKVRLYRPFSIEALNEVVPSSVKYMAVLDRTKEPGSVGEPLYQDVSLALKDRNIKIFGGRYGLSSKEFTPSMVKTIFDNLGDGMKNGFTIGINDDVSHLSLSVKEEIDTCVKGTVNCKFWGIGSDGTVGANKNSIKIIGENTSKYVQGYFQYDSKKSGGVTRSHLRFGDSPIQAEYLINNADLIACHTQAYIGRYDILEGIKENGIFLLNSDFAPEKVFENLTKDMQDTIIKKKINFYNINAFEIANKVGLGVKINTIMQVAFFYISNILDKDKAIEYIKESIKKTYAKKGNEIIEKNFKAIDEAIKSIVKIEVSPTDKHIQLKKLIPDNADDFTKDIVEKIMREKGDDIPVSKMPKDGIIPVGTAKIEKRGVSPLVPAWKKEDCIQCNQCSLVCPHAAIRPKLIEKSLLANKPASFKSIPAMAKDKDTYDYTLQVFAEDCLGCGACINECPKKALELIPLADSRKNGEVENQKFFSSLPEDVLGQNAEFSVKGSQFKQPLLEFSGACAGCGETPYVKLLTQFFGDRMIIANATGCSSIWGGTFPTVPYCKNKNGNGPAWGNSLFEDNAEYGFGMRLAVDNNRKQLKYNVEKYLQNPLSDNSELNNALKKALELWEKVDEEAKNNAQKIREMLEKANSTKNSFLKKINELKNYFVDKSVWCFGGDGWAYDIGFGGLDHVMASNRNVNIFVMDTEVYSNTGGQASKATPIGSIARFAEAGKKTTKKDLGMMMMSYEYVYVASVSMGANKMQMLKAMKEAEEYNGPSIIMAYAPCINHGIDMAKAQEEEKLAVDTGYWTLYRYNPTLKLEGKNPFILDSKEPTKPVEDILKKEKRYSALMSINKEKAQEYWKAMQEYVSNRYQKYLKMSK